MSYINYTLSFSPHNKDKTELIGLICNCLKPNSFFICKTAIKINRTTVVFWQVWDQHPPAAWAVQHTGEFSSLVLCMPLLSDWPCPVDCPSSPLLEKQKNMPLSLCLITCRKRVFQPVSREQLTFDPDVAVPLEVVVGSFPGVPVVPQKSDRRSRPDWYITHSFFVWKTKTSVGLDKTYHHHHHHH